MLSQPTLLQEGDARAHRCVFHGRKMRGVATNIYSRKMLKKPERCGLRTLSVKGSGVVFTHREGISTPRVRHKGRQPLIKCANTTSNYVIFPFLRFLCLFMPSIFFIILWSTRVFPLLLRIPQFVVRKSDLRSSLRTKRWLNCFYLFARYILIE